MDNPVAGALLSILTFTFEIDAHVPANFSA
jgi:hypothetical protein